MSRLQSEHVSIRYDQAEIIHDLSLTIPDGKITTIIGPNGCGKSTFLRALGRLQRPATGAVVLDGELIHSLPTREVAKRLGLLQQQHSLPEGISVESLVGRGRFPHQGFLQPPTRKDAEAVDRALALTNMLELRKRPVDQLSGGQRQRAWMAMILAQETSLLVLDEPTTYLDIAHQLEIIELVRRLNVDEGRTVVMVLHDVNEAASVSDHIVAMRDGRIVREGPPSEVIEPVLLEELYGVACDVYPHPEGGHPFCIPRSAAMSAVRQPSPLEHGVNVKGVRFGYDAIEILHGFSLDIAPGRITAIIGPNACGKSTLLRTCGRLLKPSGGEVQLDGRNVRSGKHRNLAQRLGLLAQGPVPPAGFLVEDLVAAGRLPHQGLLRQWRLEDEHAVDDALQRCDLMDMRYREIGTLSGGQRQRAWFGMVLAQRTPVLLLDEPTTFLDLNAQVHLLDMAQALNREQGSTVVMVLHDLNMAARYADEIIVMRAGEVVMQGPPAEVLTAEMLADVFEIEAQVSTDPHTGAPLIMPTRTIGARAAAPSTDAMVAGRLAAD